MAGDVKIGGGGSCWITSSVGAGNANNPMRVQSAFDLDAKNGTDIEITFPKSTTLKPIKVKVDDGLCIQITWK